ncbi:hypothetical protein ABZ442_04810 [Streptomyces triculaminicus]|uniref:hypothetical protein n=1 Tax=Streptomyces triculaminicus TaxID=2816232 RepID=UPI0033EB9D48
MPSMSPREDINQQIRALLAERRGRPLTRGERQLYAHLLEQWLAAAQPPVRLYSSTSG